MMKQLLIGASIFRSNGTSLCDLFPRPTVRSIVHYVIIACVCRSGDETRTGSGARETGHTH